MTEPGGGYGWRSARHLPPRRGGLLGPGRIEAALREERPLCVLLLPRPLEQLEDRARVDVLLPAPGVVAVDPARLSYRTAARLPDAVADGLAAIQARRLGLPGTPRALVIFHALQYRLARAVIAQHPDAELWYGAPEASAPAELDALAEERADLRFFPATDDRVLWERMEALGVPSGRLGSERAGA